MKAISLNNDSFHLINIFEIIKFISFIIKIVYVYIYIIIDTLHI